jgi:hypothetical protein
MCADDVVCWSLGVNELIMSYNVLVDAQLATKYLNKIYKFVGEANIRNFAWISSRTVGVTLK